MGSGKSYDDLIETRIIRDPDHVDHVIPLQPYYWDALDEMEKEGFTDLFEIVGIAWRGRSVNLEKGLRSDFTFCLNVAINEMHEHYLSRVHGYAND
jgi:hypothetical protein